jgi:ribonuclease HII
MTVHERQTLIQMRAIVAAGPPYDPALLDALEADARPAARRLIETCRRKQARAAAESARIEAMFAFEREAAAQGFRRVAGVDEAGRGPLAGPIVAAAVVLTGPVPGLNDSKQLTPEQRDTLFGVLTAGNHAIGVAEIGADEIDRHGIQVANYAAMARAVEAIDPRPDFLLVDGFAIRGCGIPQERLIKGDARSQSIAAASIIAKVTRDRTMEKLDVQFPGYGFAQHKGYGTSAHIEAIMRLGPSEVHRRSFAPMAEMPETGQLF